MVCFGGFCFLVGVLAMIVWVCFLVELLWFSGHLVVFVGDCVVALRLIVLVSLFIGCRLCVCVYGVVYYGAYW